MCSFTCSCQPGFIGSGTVCSDINECLQGSTMCGLEAFCRNTFGSYDCACQIGFYLNLGACVSCPTGTSTASVGALSSTACTMCDAGENNRLASFAMIKVYYVARVNNNVSASSCTLLLSGTWSPTQYMTTTDPIQDSTEDLSRLAALDAPGVQKEQLLLPEALWQAAATALSDT